MKLTTHNVQPNPTDVLKAAGTYLSVGDCQKIAKAFEFAAAAHANQYRKTGEPYIVHPMATARILTDYHMDAPTILAALLHDVPEDTAVTAKQIDRQFGREVAELVDGVTKLSKVRLKRGWLDVFRGYLGERTKTDFTTFDRHVETLRKMFFAMSRDIRVIIIKLADRLHNMETLGALPIDKQRRIAQETLEIYAPLADRLGIGQLKGHLQDLAFPYAFPDEFAAIRHQLSDEFPKRHRYIERVRRTLLKRLARAGIRAEAHARAKHLYSLWRKLVKYDNDLAKIYDLVAVRIIVPTIEDCYRALGLIHSLWKPLPGRIKDYIATPKPNGYQSLHTTVFALQGKITEIQIRTPEMHSWAECGVAAHWTYKELGAKAPAKPTETPTWMKELANLRETFADPTEWRKGLELDFFQDRIFVFTPHGDVLDLPTGATPVDFAFTVHSDLGRHCIGAKVNGKLVPLSHLLENGDIVEILTSRKVTPRGDWLRFVKTNKARSQIKRSVETEGKVRS